MYIPVSLIPVRMHEARTTGSWTRIAVHSVNLCSVKKLHVPTAFKNVCEVFRALHHC